MDLNHESATPIFLELKLTLSQTKQWQLLFHIFYLIFFSHFTLAFIQSKSNFEVPISHIINLISSWVRFSNQILVFVDSY